MRSVGWLWYGLYGYTMCTMAFWNGFARTVSISIAELAGTVAVPIWWPLEGCLSSWIRRLRVRLDG